MFYSLLPLQGILFEGFKSSQHFFQTVSRKARSFLCLIDFVSPVLALVFVEQVIICFLWLVHQTHACSGEIAFCDTYHCTAHIAGFWQEILSRRFCISGNTAPNRSGGSDNRSSVDTGMNRQQHTPFFVCCLDTRGQAGYLLAAQNYKYAWKYSFVLASLYHRQSQGVDCP